MNIMELVREAVEVASQDEQLREKMKGTTASIVMVCKGDSERTFTFLVDNGQLAFSEARLENPDFEFEMSMQDYYDMMTGKAYGMILMATGKMKMSKGEWADIARIAAPLSAIPKIGREIASRETVQL